MVHLMLTILSKKGAFQVLKDIHSIKICGANFTTSTELALFDAKEGNNTKDVRGTLVYGRNGTGKSTISKAIKKIAGNLYPHISQASFCDINGIVITLTEDEKKRIKVFDEEYIDKNVKFCEDSLSTIVMLGQQADLTQKIEKASKRQEVAKEQYDKQEIVVLELEKSSNDKSPMYYMNQMKLALQGDDNWAGRDKIIKGNRQNTGVRDDTYTQFVALTPDKTRDELVVAFSDKVKELEKAKQGTSAISTTVQNITIVFDIKYLKALLSLKIEKPELTEREMYLLRLVQGGKTERVNYMLKLFSNDDTKRCPTCFQPLTSNYKKDVVKSIKKVLSKIVEDHQANLRKQLQQLVVIDLKPFEPLESYGLCCKKLETLNEAINENNFLIQTKIDNPFEPQTSQCHELPVLVDELNKELERLDQERIDFNKKVQSTTPIIHELTKINNEIAHYDIIELHRKYQKQNAQLRIEQIKRVNLRAAYYDAKKEVDELEAQRKNIKIALNVINNSLKYIFFSEDRLKIEYRNERYFLISNGMNVSPKDISQGERNIIALCYFFASILENQDIEQAYAQEYLIVIDDPVSSFDMENKVGIMSFLKYQMGRFLLGNPNTRVQVMTHDILTFYDISKVFEELIEASKSKYSGRQYIYRLYELSQTKLTRFNCTKRQEYTVLVKAIYSYACGHATEYNIVIGNIMRQVLEAFATFQYKKGIDSISTDPAVLSVLPADYRDYFENLMYRLILNNGSHRDYQVRAMDDMNFFSFISDEDKKRTAKEVITFLYLINKQHIVCHLNGEQNVERNIEEWKEEIKNRAVSL